MADPRRVDLHTHSHFSDGTLSPTDLVRRAARQGVELLFLTDHDSIAGFPEAQAAGLEAGLPVRCGIEINTSAQDQVHILGYGIDWTSAAFLATLEEFRARRRRRAEMIVEKLNAHGIALAMEEVRAAAHDSDPEAPLGRPHVADALRAKGVVRSREEAFARFLSRGKPGYVEPMGPSPEEAIALIRQAGGFASLAHPETISGLDQKLPGWKESGLEGLEAYYGAHGPSARAKWEKTADRMGLLPTGGSDFHGPGTGRDKILGVEAPAEACDRFLRRLADCAVDRA